jgi:uncharacterized protein with beta-barrel porin domain
MCTASPVWAATSLNHLSPLGNYVSAGTVTSYEITISPFHIQAGGSLWLQPNDLLTITNTSVRYNAGQIFTNTNSMLTNIGTLHNSGDLIVFLSTLDNVGTLWNNYRIFLNSGTLNNAGTLQNSGLLSGGSGSTLANTGTLINSGTLDNLFNGILTNSGTLINSGTLEMASGSAYDFTGGTLTNTGTFILRRNFDFDGTTGGTVNLDAGGILQNYAVLTNTAGHTQTNNGALVNNAGATLINTGTLINSGTLEMASGSAYDFTGGTLTNTGTFILRRNFDFDGTTGGTVNLDAGGILQNYAVLTNTAGHVQTNNGALVNNAGATLTNDGVLINNFGATLTNAAGGTLNNNGLFTNNGTLTNNGSFTGDLTNNSTLSGNGTITGNVTNSGILAPGNSIGTTTIVGNYTHAAGATYTVEANAAGQSDKLIVTGTATLNGGTVEVLAENGIYKVATNYSYTILTAGSVVGTFANVTSNLAFLTPSLSYDPGNVYLLLTRNSTNFADVAGSSNQYAIASSLDRTSPTATGDMADVINAVYGLSAPGARGAYDQMGGLTHISLTGATFSSFNRYMDILSSRMGGLGSPGYRSSSAGQPPMFASRMEGIADAGTTLISALQATAAQNTTAPSFDLWVKGYGSLGERRGGDISSRYDYDMAGIAAGFDRRIGQSFLFGVSLGYVHTNTDMKDLSDDGTISSYQGSLYGSFIKGPFYLNGIAAYGYNRYDTTRNISFGAITRRATARYDGETAGGSLEGGYRIITVPVDIIPFASLRGIYLTRDGFRERNAPALALDADSDNASSLMSSLGMRFTKDYKVSSGTLTPEVSLKWGHEFINDDYVLNASFAGYPASTFTVKGDRPDRDSLGTGLALTYQTAGNVYFCLTYDGTFSGDTTEHAGTAGLRVRW